MSYSCGCGRPYYTYPPSSYYPAYTTNCDALPSACSSGCPIQLDATCVFYHLLNNEVTALTNLSIANGATLDVILTVIDGYIGQLKVQDFDIPFLRESFVINTLEQFITAVDTKLSEIQDTLDTLDPPDTGVNNWLGNLTSDPGAAVNGNYWFNTNEVKLKIKVNDIVKEIVTV